MLHFGAVALNVVPWAGSLKDGGWSSVAEAIGI
jgi:hypothetical protein